MAEKEKKEKAVSLDEIAKAVDKCIAMVRRLSKEKKELEDRVERHSANWREFAKIAVHENSDGKIGRASISLLLGVCLVGMIAVSAFAAEQVVINLPAPEGTDAVVQFSADDGDDAADVGELIMTTTGTMKIDVGGTTAATMTSTGIIATIYGASTGDVTCDDINMSGSATDSIGFNLTATPTVVTGQVATVNLGNMGRTPADTCAITHRLLTMVNDSGAESINWSYINSVIDDASSNSEDTAVEVYIQVGGAATKALNIDAAGVDSGTLKLLGTAGDFGDGDVDNVGDITLDTITADGSAITINSALTLASTVTATGAVTTVGNATVGGVLGVTGAQTNTANLVVNGTQLQGDGATIIRGFESMNLEGTLVVTGLVTAIGNAGVGGVLAVTGAQTNTANVVVNGTMLQGDGATVIRGFEDMVLEGTLVSTGLVTCIAGADMGDLNIANVQSVFVDALVADGGTSITLSNTMDCVNGTLRQNARAVAVSKDTTPTMVDHGTGTFTASRVYTNTFNPVFLETPAVCATYTVTATNDAPFISSAASNEVIFGGHGGLTFNWIATGNR